MDSTRFAAAVAAELRAERARKQLSQDDLVEATGLSKSAVVRYLNGQREIPLPAYFALCDALHVSPTVVFERVEESLEQD